MSEWPYRTFCDDLIQAAVHFGDVLITIVIEGTAGNMANRQVGSFKRLFRTRETRLRRRDFKGED